MNLECSNSQRGCPITSDKESKNEGRNKIIAEVIKTSVAAADRVNPKRGER